MSLVTSRYNLAVSHEEGALLFNTNSGAILHMRDEAGAQLARALCEYPAILNRQGVDEVILNRLQRAGFILDEADDELDTVRKRFDFSRRNAAAVITVMVTNDCNLGCYYCFQSRTNDGLDGEKEAATLAYLKQRIETCGKDRIHVNWYGGEPMLKRDYISRLSRALQEFAVQHGIKFEASILSNGTFWPVDPLAFTKEHKLSTVQITFDGTEATHNKIRRRRDKAGPVYNQFAEAVRVVSAIHEDCHVEVRFNLGPRNTQEIYDFVDFALKRGWFREGSKAKLQLAKISPYSKGVDFIRSDQLLYTEFERIVDSVREMIPDHFLDANTALGGLPKPRRAVCSAIAEDSFIIGADRKIYNCGLQVGEAENAVASINRQADERAEQEQASWWRSFDPTERPKCRVCTFLPLCWGSCPKLHLEDDEHYLDEQSEYWRNTLPKRILNSVGATTDVPFDESQQFKTGKPEDQGLFLEYDES